MGGVSRPGPCGRAGPLVTAALLLLATPLRAQVTPDTLREEADSARLQILRRLERLARLPGADSVLYVQDSARMAQAAAGQRGGGAGMDTVATALLGMPGFSLTEYEAESARFDAPARVLVLQAPADGRARVSQEGSVFEADTSIVFNEETGSIRAVGNGTFTPPDGDAVEAANMIYDINQRRGTALDARTSFAQDGANWLVRGDMPYAAPDSTFLSHARFTSCDLEVPHYHFETDEIKIVAGNVLVARGVRLYFADVPVAWLPFMAQSLARGRSSGLLTPRFSVNDIVRSSGGYRRRLSNVGFYWAMSDYSDALVAMDWFSETFFSLTSSLRYRFNRRFLEGDVNFREYWRADGSTEQALDTRHSWQMDERTQLRISGRYVSSNDFVRRESFNPREVTQSIDSEAGLNRRFDWGTVSASANRKQYLSDDRTEWLLPSVNLSLSPITLFRAPSSDAGIFNNMTWSASSGVRRNTVDRAPPDTFSIGSASTVKTAGNARSNLSIGRLTFSQSVDLSEDRTLDVPEAYLLVADSAGAPLVLTGGPARDIADMTLGWSASLNYQQQLIGSTTITPRLSMRGSMFQSDTDSLAGSFVSAPTRMSFGATLKTDIYGFFGGVGPFEAIRHKISPSFEYEWTPETTPSELQRNVFRSRALQPRNTISMSLTQTFEAKRRTDEEEEQAGAPAPPAAGPGAPTERTERPGALGRLGAPPGAGAVPGVGAGIGANGQEQGPRRVQQAPTVTLLAWRTSVVRYDFVEADSVGSFLAGFETTRLSNQFSSDYLRGLSISMDHELFEDEVLPDGSPGGRSFSPHLSSVNLGFSLGSSSSIFRWLGLGGGGDQADEPEPAGPEDFEGPTDESSIVPVSGRETPAPQASTARGSRGGWTANLSYSLQRFRDPSLPASQMLSGTVRLEPTDNWSVSWRTAYDLELGAFNDHSIRLTRDLHRWQAHFDFLQTATGNWSFRFEVSLMDNRDLKFDYRQRNLDLGLPSSQR